MPHPENQYRDAQNPREESERGREKGPEKTNKQKKLEYAAKYIDSLKDLSKLPGDIGIHLITGVEKEDAEGKKQVFDYLAVLDGMNAGGYRMRVLKFKAGESPKDLAALSKSLKATPDEPINEGQLNTVEYKWNDKKKDRYVSLSFDGSEPSWFFVKTLGHKERVLNLSRDNKKILDAGMGVVNFVKKEIEKGKPEIEVASEKPRVDTKEATEKFKNF